MALLLPDSASEVINRQKTDVQRELPESNPFLPNSWLSALIVGNGNGIFDFYLQLKEAIKQTFFDTSTGTFLERQASWFGVIRLAATQASGNLIATGTLASTIPISTKYQASNGIVYISTAGISITNTVLSVTSLVRSGSTVTATTSVPHNLSANVSVTIAGAVETDFNGAQEIIPTSTTEFTYESSGVSGPATGTITATFDSAIVPVISDPSFPTGFGVDTNQEENSTLSLQAPIAGVDDIAGVDFNELAGGTDLENDESLRTRFFERIQSPIAHFNDAEITAKAKEINGVTRVFITDAFPVAGQVTIFFMRDNDVDPIPTAPEVTTVKNKILEIKPANTADVDVIVNAPTPVVIGFTFTALSPNTLTMQNAVTANLQQFFDEETEVSVDIEEDAYRSAIFNTVDPDTGDVVKSFSLSTPTGDITITSGEIGVLNSIVYPAIP